MKAYILTQPLGNNFGGLMQAIQLREELLDIGYTSVHILNVDYVQSNLQRLKNIAAKLIYPDRSPEKALYDYTNLQREVNELEYVIHVNSYKDLSNLVSVDLIIIGSDQVWRKNYSPNLWSYYGWRLDRVSDKIISYAASLGLDRLEGYTTIDKLVIKKLLRKFSGISVRENSAVQLFTNTFNQKPIVSLDPAFFFSKRQKFYATSLDVSDEISSYILDRGNLAKFRSLCEDTTDLSDCTLSPTLNDWINWFHNSRFIVTDSYHGMIMSIVFQKQFVVIPNEGRGRARFETVLEKVGLKGRMLEQHSMYESIISNQIDYDVVGNILADELYSSRLYLERFLVK